MKNKLDHFLRVLGGCPKGPLKLYAPNIHWLAVELRRIPLERHMTIVDLAQASGVSKQAIGNFENGHCRMYADNIDRVLQALGYELDLHQLDAH